MTPAPILIIDDDPVARLLVASVLVDAGYPVDTVSSVAAALAADGDWGAVVLDPQVEDFLLDDTVERLRAACRAPIIISTAPEIAADPDIGQGADAVLARIDDHERALLAQVQRALGA